jgi:hypothetical protein
VADARPGELTDSFAPCGPANNYCEDNDTPATAFGPLEFGTGNQAYPDDDEDYYYFELSSPEVVDVSLSDFAPTSSNGTIVLYGPADGDALGEQIDYYGPAGHTSMSLDPHGLGPGKYHVWVYTTGDHSITQLYTLTVTAESQRDFLPLLLLNYPPNEPPHIPSSPAPADGATDVNVKVNLSWVGGDPEGDSVAYDVYLEADDSVPENLVCDGVTSTVCDPGVLNSGTHYYWKVVATDENGLITMGPAWHFTTQEIINRLVRWRSEDRAFNDWELDDVRIAVDGTLELDVATAPEEVDPYGPGGYYGRNFYNGSSFLVGEAIGPLVETPVTFTEAIASWNAHTPPGTWIETQIRAQLGDRWSKWYNLGVWAADASTVERHSVAQQGDADGYVAVDTLVVTNDTEPLRSYQLKLRLFSENGAAVPTVRNASVALSEPPASPDALVPGRPEQWDSVLSVPECSQMVYPDGGEVWCSPTSTSMVLAYWNQDTGPCEPRVRAAVAGVYDWLYNGHGNWPFNTAYAATHGLEAYVARFTSLAQAEEWIAAGVPVVVSIAWGPGELPGAPLPYSSGHLLVLVGFDADGNPVVNDPAFPSDDEVRHTYIRSKFETLWLKHTSGTAYLIYPPHWSLPDF